MSNTHNLSLRKFIKTGVSAIALAGLSTFGLISIANADKYPNKPIQLVIHAKYGGGTDTTARMVSIRTRRNLKQIFQLLPKEVVLVLKLRIMSYLDLLTDIQ